MVKLSFLLREWNYRPSQQVKKEMKKKKKRKLLLFAHQSRNRISSAQQKQTDRERERGNMLFYTFKQFGFLCCLPSGKDSLNENAHWTFGWITATDDTKTETLLSWSFRERHLTNGRWNGSWTSQSTTCRRRRRDFSSSVTWSSNNTTIGRCRQFALSLIVCGHRQWHWSIGFAIICRPVAVL